MAWRAARVKEAPRRNESYMLIELIKLINNKNTKKGVDVVANKGSSKA